MLPWRRETKHSAEEIGKTLTQSLVDNMMCSCYQPNFAPEPTAPHGQPLGHIITISLGLSQPTSSKL